MSDPKDPRTPPTPGDDPRPEEGRTDLGHVVEGVRFRDADGPVLLEATSMTVSYTPWNLWTARRRSIEVVLEHPVIRLGRGPDGRLQLPEWRSGHNAKPSTREVEILLHVVGADV